MSVYATYHELTCHEKEGRDYRIHVRRGSSRMAVVAPHGGGIEPGTMEIADTVAGNEHAFYCFEGIKSKGNANLHITSGNFDEPRGLDLLGAADVVLAVHGCKEEDKAVLVGGLHDHLRRRVCKALVHAGFRVEESVRPMLGGESPRNMCNRGRARAGVQLEICKGLRKQMFVDTVDHKGGSQKTESFYTFVSALRKVLSRYEAKTPVSPIHSTPDSAHE